MSEAKHYRSETIEVTFDGGRCIHAAECIRGLPAVFDTDQRPWIQPSAAAAEEIAAVIARCPSGALHAVPRDGGPAEVPDAANTICVQADGPYYMRGNLRVVTADGALVVHDLRMALCRCGQSQNKPFCDNAHIDAGFHDPGTVASTSDSAAPAAGFVAVADAPLTIKLRSNGPLKLDGGFTLVGAADEGVHRASEAALCRCGGSANKPFCDGSHRHNGFQG